MKKLSLILTSLLMVAGLVSCQKEIVDKFEKPTDVVNPNPPAPPTVYEHGLAELASKVGLKLGTAFTRSEYFSNDSVKVIIARDFDAVTFGNEMKHDAIVGATGKMNFKTADEMAGWAADCGAELFGHNLGWHQQQQTAYLESLISKADDENAESLLKENWRFESGELAPFTGTAVITSSPRETFAGEYSAKAGDNGATLITPAVNVDAEAVAISFWAKGNGNIELTTSDSRKETIGIEGSWVKYIAVEKVKNGSDYSVTLNLPAGTVIDNIHLTPVEIEEEGGAEVNYINPYTLVEDGGFETFELGPAGQNGWGPWNGPDYITVTDEQVHSGARAIKLDNSTGVASNAWDIQYAAPSYDVTPGKTYRLAWYAKASTEADFQIDVRGISSSTLYFSSQYNQFAKPGEDWVYCFVDVPCEEGCSTVQVVFYGGCAPATYYIDDFQVFEAILEGDYTNYIDKNNLLPGADFEGQWDWGVWNGSDYATFVNRNIAVGEDGTETQQIDVNKDKVHSALRALVVDNTTTGYSGGDAWHVQVANNTPVDVEAGKEYRIGLWAKSPDGFDTIQIELRWDTGATDYIQVPGITDDWGFIYIDKIAPDGATTVQIVIDCAYCPGTVYIDDFQIYPKPVESFIDPASLVENGDFENLELGDGQSLLNAGWPQVNGASYVSVVEDAHSGKRAIKMDNSAGECSNGWDIQLVTPSVPVEAGKTYRIAWYGKGDVEDLDMQIDIREDGSAVSYNSSAWGQYAKMQKDWTYQYLDYTVAAGSELAIAFYGAGSANIFMIDDFQIFPVEAAAPAVAAAKGYGKYAKLNYERPAANLMGGTAIGVELNTKLDGEPVDDCIDFAYKSFVYGMVEHFDVYGWDVMNETFTEQGNWRSPENTSEGFIWGKYYGGQKNFVDKAFAYTVDAMDAYGKTADLYINDYNLETSPSKLAAICNYAKENPNVTGIGSQMHLTANEEKIEAQKAAITDMLKAMVETGKLVRISELDIVIESGGTAGLQADMYVYVFDQYLTLVPEAQRGGITIWGINDKDSWRDEANAPLLYSGKKYERKPAYEALYLYLKEKAGM